MNDKEILMETGVEQESVVHGSHHSVYGTFFALLVCFALALVVWIGVMNTQDTDYIPVSVATPNGYECVLSVDGVEVQGRVSDLRGLDRIVITIPTGLAAGTYYVPAEMLELPDGVTLTQEWNATLTITVK